MIEDNQELGIGFKDSTEFCVHLEQIKIEHSFDTYIETVVWYSEHESDMEIEDLTKHLNKKIKDSIAFEATNLNLLKSKEKLVSLF